MSYSAGFVGPIVLDKRLKAGTNHSVFRPKWWQVSFTTIDSRIPESLRPPSLSSTRMLEQNPVFRLQLRLRQNNSLVLVQQRRISLSPTIGGLELLV